MRHVVNWQEWFVFCDGQYVPKRHVRKHARTFGDSDSLSQCAGNCKKKLEQHLCRQGRRSISVRMRLKSHSPPDLCEPQAGHVAGEDRLHSAASPTPTRTVPMRLSLCRYTIRILVLLFQSQPTRPATGRSWNSTCKHATRNQGDYSHRSCGPLARCWPHGPD